MAEYKIRMMRRGHWENGGTADTFTDAVSIADKLAAGGARVEVTRVVYERDAR